MQFPSLSNIGLVITAKNFTFSMKFLPSLMCLVIHQVVFLILPSSIKPLLIDIHDIAHRIKTWCSCIGVTQHGQAIFYLCHLVLISRGKLGVISMSAETTLFEALEHCALFSCLVHLLDLVRLCTLPNQCLIWHPGKFLSFYGPQSLPICS
jgi:hypothetical protein